MGRTNNDRPRPIAGTNPHTIVQPSLLATLYIKL